MNNIKSVIASNTIFLNSIIKFSQFFPEIVSKEVENMYKIVHQETLVFIDESIKEMRKHDQYNSRLTLYESLLKKYPEKLIVFQESEI
jgi:hypothetical protein